MSFLYYLILQLIVNGMIGSLVHVVSHVKEEQGPTPELKKFLQLTVVKNVMELLLLWKAATYTPAQVTKQFI